MPSNRQRFFKIEPLEKRLLLSATPMADLPENVIAPEAVEEVFVEAVSTPAAEAQFAMLAEDAVFPEVTTSSATLIPDVTIESSGVLVTTPVTISSGENWLYRSTTGSVFFTQDALVNGTNAATQESLLLDSAQDVFVSAPIGIISPVHHLVVSAGQNIVFEKNILLTGDLIIEAGASVVFQSSVRVGGSVKIGDSEDLSAVGSVQFQNNALLEVGGIVEIYTSGNVSFDGNVGGSVQPQAIIIDSNGTVTFNSEIYSDVLSVCALNISVTSDILVDGNGITADPLSLTATNSLLLGGFSSLSVDDGGMMLSANSMAFNGGSGSISSVGTNSSLIIKPYTASLIIGVAEASGNQLTRLDLSSADLVAIDGSFSSVVIGDSINGTGQVRIGAIGLSQSGGSAQILNPTTFVGGSVLVEGPIDVASSAEELRLVALQSDVLINGVINETVAERSATVRLEAEGDIIVNRAIYATDFLSLSAGFSDGIGTVVVNDSGVNSGTLVITSDAGPEGRIQITSGETTGDIIFNGTGLDLLISVFGADSELALRARGGAITQTNGLIEASVLAVVADADVILRTKVDRLGNVQFGGEALSSGLDEVIEGVRISGVSGTFTLVESDDLIIDRLTTAGGDVNVSTLAGSGGNLRLGLLNAAGGDYTLDADGAIIDHLEGLDTVNLTTSGHATLSAKLGIGSTGTGDLDTDLGSLAATNSTSGGIYLHDRGDLLIAGAGVQTLAGNGNIALSTVGALIVDNAATVLADGSGNVLLNAGTTLYVGNANVASTSGVLTVLANAQITLEAGASLNTATAGSILLSSETAGLVMDATASITAENANIRIETAQSALIAQIIAESVSLLSGVSIFGTTGSSANITATNLRIESESSVGTSTDRLRTSVTTLAVNSNGTAASGIYISQTGDLIVDSVAPVELQTFAADGTLSPLTDTGALSDLTANSGGDIILVVSEGALTLEDTLGDGISVNALGGGSVYLETITPGDAILANASVSSETGALSVRSAGALTLGADVLFTSTGGGAIHLEALAGDLSMIGGSSVVDGDGAVVLIASGDIYLATVNADAAQISSENGAIFNATGAILNVSAASLLLSANTGLGLTSRALTVDVDTFAAEVTGESAVGIFVAEQSALSIEAVTVTGDRFDVSGGVVGFSESLNHVIATTGEIELSTQTDLVVVGSARVETLEAGASLNLSALDGSLTLADGALVRSNSGDIDLTAGLNTALSIVDAQGGDIRVISEQGAIIDSLSAEAPNLITSGLAHLEAATGIGAVGAGNLNTDLGSLSALNSDSGLIVISEVSDLIILSLSNLGSAGSILVQSTGGSMTLDGPIYAAEGGNILLQASGDVSDLTINDTITAAEGSISLEASGDLNINSVVEAVTLGTLDLLTPEGAITFSVEGRALTSNQNIRIKATGDAVLTGVDAGTADVSVMAASISDAGDAVRDITASGLRIITSGSIGVSNAMDLDVDALSVRALSGSVNLSNLNDLRIGIVNTVPVERVRFDNTSVVITDLSKIRDILADGDLSVMSENGSVEVRELSPDEVSFGGESVGANQATSASVVDSTATPTVSDTTREIGGFGVALDPSVGYSGVAFTGGAQVVFFDSANFGVVNASVQNSSAADFIRLEATKPESFPTDNAAHLNAFVAFDTPRMIYSDIGGLSTETAGGMSVDTEIRFMLETADGRFFLSEQTMSGNASAQTLALPSIADAVWAEFTPDTDGDWRGDYESLTFDQVLDPFEVVARAGVFSSRSVPATAIEVSSVLTVRSFELAVRESLRQDIAINAANGAISLTATENILQNASILAESGEQITLIADNGFIRMDEGVLSSGTVADIEYVAAEQIELSTLQSGTGDIIVTSGDRITDNRLSDDANLMTPGLVTLSAVNGIGVFGAGDLLTDIGSLTATNTASGDIVIRELDGLVIAPAGVSALVGDSSVIITVEEGDLAVNGAVSVSGTGRLLLNALGTSAAADLMVNASIETASGSISLLAENDVSFTASGSATVLSASGTIDLQAIGGALTMDGDSVIQSDGASIRLLSQETVTLGVVDGRSNAARLADTLDDQATWGDLTVRSITGAIIDGRDRLDATPSVFANAARFLAIQGIGQTGVGVDNSINVEAALLAASTTQGVINVSEATTLEVGSVDPLSVDRVDTNANVSSVGDVALLSGLTASGLVDGAIILRTFDGSLVVNNTVQVSGNGSILLQASGLDSDVLLDANVFSTSGSISLQADRSIALDPTVLIQTAGTGTIDIFAVDGSVEMADSSRALTTTGSVRIEAGADLLLSNVESLVNVALIAGGSILDNGDTQRDVNAAGLLLQAGVGAGTLGASANPLEISVNTLTARAGSGGVNIRESNALSLGQLKVDVLRVAGDASTATETTGEQAGVLTTEGNGSVVIRLSEGNLTLSDTVLMVDRIALATHGAGNVLLETLGNFTNIGLNGGIETGGGNVTLVATSAVTLAVATEIAVNGSGDIAIFTQFGGIVMDGTSRMTSATGDIRLSSLGDILVGGIETEGTVSLITLGASVLNNSSTQINVTADALRLQAAVGLGTLVPLVGRPVVPFKTDVNTLSARSEFGNITLEEVDGLTIDDVGIEVNRVESNATTSTVSDAVQSDVRTQINNRHIVLRSLAGDIVLNEGITGSAGAAVSDNTGVAVVGNGRILIEAVSGDVIANADVLGVAGDISVIAGETIQFAGNANVITGDNAFSTGTLYIEAVNGSVEQIDGSQFIATLGDVRIAAGDSIRLANVTTTANVSLIADSGSILDAGDTDIDVSAAQLRLEAGTGIGMPGNLLDTAVDVLAATAGDGGIFIQDAGALLIGDTSATVLRCNPDNSTSAITDATLSDIRTTEGDSSIVLRALGGDLTLNDGSAPGDNSAVSAHGAGNVRLDALSSGADIRVNADVVSASGHITLSAERDVRFIALADLTTSGAGTVNIEAGSGLIEMNDQTKFTAESGDLRLTARGNISLGGIETSGNVALTSEAGSVLDNGDFYTDVVASGLRVVASIGVGSLDALNLNLIKTRVATLSARATAGGVNILEETGLTVDDVAVTVQRVGTDALGTTTTEQTQSDVRTTDGNGSIVLRTTAGDIILNDGTVLSDLNLGTDNVAVSAHGSGNILVEAIGAATGIDANADLFSGTGHISLIAHTDVNMNTTADAITSGDGSVFIEAQNGQVNQADNSRLVAENGDVRIWASDSIVLGGVTTGGNVSLVALNGSISDAGDAFGGDDVVASGLRMEAGIGIGAPSNHLETRIEVLSARATSGGIFIVETDALRIDGVGATVERVLANALTTPETDAVQSDVHTTAGNGSIVIRTLGGHLTLNDGSNPADNTVVSANGSGNIRLEAEGVGTDLLANADIRSGTGHISLHAQRDLKWIANAEVSTSGGTLNIEAVSGSVVMDDLASFDTLSGDVRILAGVDVLLGGISTSGNVAITALAGSILDNGDTNIDVVAKGLSMNAGIGVGELGAGTDNSIETDVMILTARATSGGVNVLEANALVVDAVEVTVQIVRVDAALIPTVSTEQTGVFTESGNGTIVLQTLAGDMTLNNGSGIGAGTAVSANGSGNVLLAVLGADTDVTVNSALLTGTGHINVFATSDVVLSSGSTVTTDGNGTVYLEAMGGDFTQADDSRVVSSDGDIRIVASDTIQVGGITTDSNVSLIAQSGSILDAGNAFGGEDIVADQLSLRAAVGVGLSSAPVEVDVNALSARATSGGIFLLESNAVTVGDTTATVQQVLADGTISVFAITDATQSDLRTTGGNGAIVLQSVSGIITLDTGSAPASDTAIAADGSGNVLIEALGAGTDVTVNGDVLSGSGHVNVLAGGEVGFTNTGDVRTAMSGTIFVQAVSGSVTMSDQSLLQSVDGDVRVFAGESITLGGVETAANVSLIASNGSILDGGDHYIDVVADQLRLVAGVGIGTSINPLDTTVTTLSARATSGGVFILETDSLTIDNTSATVQRIAKDASFSPVSDLAQSDVMTTALNGSIVIRTLNGDLLLNAGSAPGSDNSISANGSGNILLETLGAGSSITANADILSGSGHVSVISSANVSFTGTAEIETSGDGTVYIEASSGSVSMTDLNRVQSLNGDIRILADASITLGSVETAANVSLLATQGSIVDGGNSFVDVIANQLRMVAGIGVGQSSNALETSVSVLSARATSGGIYILESDSIAVDATTAIVQRVGFDAGLSPITDGAQSDLRTTGGNGSIVLSTTNGNITLNEGNAPADTTAISAHGSGNVLIDALADGTDVEVNADIRSGTGHILLRGGSEIVLEPNVSLVTDGVVQANARAGSFVMGDAVVIDAGSNNIRIFAGVNILLGELITSGDISLTAVDGSILDNTDPINGLTNLLADSVRMVAGIGIGVLGTNAKAVTSEINVLAATATAGGVNLLENNALTVDSVGVTFLTVNPDGTASIRNDAEISDVRTLAANGSIVLRTLLGNLSLNDGLPGDGTAVHAHGSGNILLEVAGAGADLVADADILSDSGHITLIAQRDIRFNAETSLSTGGTGTLSLQTETGAIEMHDTARFVAVSGDIELIAQADILVGGIETVASVALTSENGSVLDNGDTYVDVIASSLRASAEGIGLLGAGQNPLNTTIDSFAGRALEGGINISNTSALSIGRVGVTIQRVSEAGEFSQAVSNVLIDSVFTASGNGSIVIQTVGELTSTGDHIGGIAVSADGSGNVLLRSASDDISLNGKIESEFGNISLEAAKNLNINSDSPVTTGGSGTLDLLAIDGSIVVDTLGLIESASGAVRLQASSDIVIHGVLRSDANVSLIATNGSITGGNSAGQIDVEAAGLRLVAGEGVGSSGVLGQALETQVSSISGRADAEGIRILNTGDLEIAHVAVTIQRVEVTAGSIAITDISQNDLITTNVGSLLINLIDGALTANGGVSSLNSGPVRLAASDGIFINRVVSADDASVTLVSPADIILTETGQVRVGGSGSIYIESINGLFTMADRAQLNAASGNIRVSAAGELSLGGLKTFGQVVLISMNGLIVSAGSTLLDVVASDLRIEALGAGTDANTLQTRVNSFSAEVGLDGLYLNDHGAPVVSPVELLTNQVLADGTTQIVRDVELSGVVAVGGPIVLTSLFDLTLSTLITDLSATLTSRYGAILNAGSDASSVQVGGSLSLSADNGIGQTGSGSLNISAGVLTLTNRAGSVYLKLLDSTELAGAKILGSGDFYLLQDSGILQLSDTIEVSQGRAVITATEALQLNADILVRRDLRIVADTLTVNGARLIAESGDVVIRTGGSLTFEANSGATASNGNIFLVSGGILTVGELVSSALLDLRSQGNILRSGGELTATAIRLFSKDGNLGSALNPLLTNSDRIDLNAFGSIHVSESGDIQIGRSGIGGGGEGPNDILTLDFGAGRLTSVSDSIKFEGEGTFIVNASGELTLATPIIATNGNVTINAAGLRDGTISEGLLIDARNGRVSIVTINGVGGTENGDIEIAAQELTATTQTGSLELDIAGSTQIVAEGLKVNSGGGIIDFDIASGSLVVNAPIRHGGSGSINVNLNNGNLTLNSQLSQTGSGNLLVLVANGGINMSNSAVMQTNSGLLDVRASGFISLTRLSTTTGSVYLQSTTDSIRRPSSYVGVNIISPNRPTVNVVKVAQFAVDSSSLNLNGSVIFRTAGSFIIIGTVFS